MRYFTADNTEGFTAEQLHDLNRAHEVLVASTMTQCKPTPDRSQLEKSTGDTLLNLWRADCWERHDLVHAALSR